MRGIAAVLSMSVVITLVTAAPLAAKHAADPATSIAVHKPAPLFTLPARDGGTVSLEALRGRLVYLDFWASWCGPCRASFPWLKTMHERYVARGLSVVAINVDKSRGDALGFLHQFPAPFLVAFDPDGKTPAAYGVPTMPTSFLIGPTGEILHVEAGFDTKDADALEALIQGALPR